MVFPTRSRTSLNLAKLGMAVAIGAAVAIASTGSSRAQDDAERSRLREALMTAGLKALAGGENEVAVRQFSELTALEETNKEAWFYLGVSRMRERRWDEAQKAFEKYRDLDTAKSNGEARRLLGDALSAQGRYDQAVDAYGEALEADPTDEIAKSKKARAAALQKPKLPDASPAPAQPPALPVPLPSAKPAEAAKPPPPPPPLSSLPRPASPPPSSDFSWDQGVMGMSVEKHRVWVHLGGCFLYLLVWPLSVGSCARAFRFPLKDEEIRVSVFLGLIATLIFFIVWWGYATPSRWLGFGLASFYFGASTATALKRANVATLISWVNDQR